MAGVEELEAKLKQLEQEVQVLKDIEAIMQLKGRYFRCLDSKLWDELAECFTQDATCSFSGGKYAFKGRDAIMKFLKEGLRSNRLSMHHGHHPEIQMTGDTTARGVWGLEDYVIFKKTNTGLRGAAFYQDEYVKVGGQWKIRHTGYNRIFEEMWDRGRRRAARSRPTCMKHVRSEASIKTGAGETPASVWGCPMGA